MAGFERSAPRSFGDGDVMSSAAAAGKITEGRKCALIGPLTKLARLSSMDAGSAGCAAICVRSQKLK